MALTGQGGFERTTGAENSHLPIRRRERKTQLQISELSQRFLTTRASVYNTFYTQRHLISRDTLTSLQPGELS